MKNKFILAAFCILFFTTCKRLVEPKVYSVLTDENAFLTQSDAIAGVNAAYSRLKQPSGRSDSWMYYAGFQVTITDLTTDVGSADSGGDVTKMANCQWSPTNTYLAFAWQHQYKLVAEANNGLYYIPKIKAIKEEEIKQFSAELRFLRALGYIDLTDAFGPVILMTEETVAKNIQNPKYEEQLPVTSVEEMNKFIISDLEYAIANLPVNYEKHPIYPTNDVGRAAKGSAMALLVKLYMREHQWDKVVSLTSQINSLNQYSLFPSYEGLFAEKNKWCPEFMFNAMANVLNDAVEIRNHFGPVNHPKVTDRWQYFAVTWHFWNTFNVGDDRREMFYYDYVSKTGVHHIQPPEGQTTPPAGYFYLSDVATKKYADPEGSTTYYDGHVFPILRYADMVLCRAEALNELSGPNAESISLINSVKSRSHATLLDGSLSSHTKESMRNAILQERGWEFFFECKRRQDLIRMGKYQEVVNAYLKATRRPETINIAKHKYFPYPQAQVDLNPNLNNANR